MKETLYKNFSWRIHKKNWSLQKANICQFELTFKCGLHCRHCYSDCFNKARYIEKELDTKQVKLILDKLHQAGIVWLCFTGGDPLTRPDFLEIYAYAKEKGFIITLFTNGYSMSKKVADYLENKPPFVVEVTLNSISKGCFEKITQIEGSFEKTMAGIFLLLKKRIPLKIKTQLTRDNFKELPRIKEFVENKHLDFMPSFLIHSRLNGDNGPCRLRLSSRQLQNLFKIDKISAQVCLPKPSGRQKILFNCAAGGGDGFFVDPYGNMFLCNLLRTPFVDLVNNNIYPGLDRLTSLIRNKEFSTNSKCRLCQIRKWCLNCPGRAYLETGSKERSVPWFCRLAKLLS
ncbi:MAG: radical SAM protein [Candidatus Omnitrophica bacterium]|nr:radical SAM protein [Candidatus Omnitrophota bacterium]